MRKVAGTRAKPARASIDAVLTFAWDAEIFVATDAMEATGLTRSTTIEAISELIDLGLLRELPNARATGDYLKGRPSRRFELLADAAVVVGVDAGRSRLTTVVADLRGSELARQVMQLDVAEDTREGRRSAVIAAIGSTVSMADADMQRVLAVCVGVPAPVDGAGVSPHQPDGFWQRMNPGLRDMLEQHVPIVRVENDATLAAVAEGSVGMAKGLHNFVVLLAGDRLGAGVVIDGHLLRGQHGGVGEMRAFDHVRGVNSVEGIGLRLAEWARADLEAGIVPSTSALADLKAATLTGRTVLHLARAGDVWAQGLVERSATLLSRVALMFSSLYDPSRIIVAGAVAADLGEVLQAAQAQFPPDWELPVPELVRSRLGADAVVTGAVSAARGAALNGILLLDSYKAQPGPEPSPPPL